MNRIVLTSKLLAALTVFCTANLFAQFDPPAGQPGSLAIYKDSSIFLAWANACTVSPGYQDISNTSLGFASAGDSSMATGIAGSNGTVSLGDGGFAILRFADPVANGPGPDFAVFENGFSDTFLELAFVEVSSDGINFFRFPAVSNTQDTAQISSFGAVDATQIHNLAGKYRVFYGTPFDLDDLDSIPGLDVTRITHVKIIDVVGCIQESFATTDANLNFVNDPWPTGFASSGFDLDAVGVIHVNPNGIQENNSSLAFSVYPNPAESGSVLQINGANATTSVYSMNGMLLLETNESQIQTAGLAPGLYYLVRRSAHTTEQQKLIIR